jgi:hypothetical protein
MKLAQIHPGDLIEVDKRGRRVFAKVIEISDAVVQFEPLCPGISYRHASAREIVAHWRKAGRRASRLSDEREASAATDAAQEQLELRTSL